MLRRLNLAVPSLLALFALAGSFPAARAQSPPQPVSWSAALEPAGAVARPGGSLALLVTVKIDEGWHVYGTEDLPNGPRPLRIALAPGQPFRAGKLSAPEATRDFDPAFEQVTTFYGKTTTFRLPVTVSGDAKPGETAVGLEVGFQACDGRVCLPSRTVKLSVPVQVGTGPRARDKVEAGQTDSRRHCATRRRRAEVPWNTETTTRGKPRPGGSPRM